MLSLRLSGERASEREQQASPLRKVPDGGSQPGTDILTGDSISDSGKTKKNSMSRIDGIIDKINYLDADLQGEKTTFLSIS